MQKPPLNLILGLTFAAVAVILVAPFGQANCLKVTQVSLLAGEEHLASAYQPTDGTALGRYRYQPDPTQFGTGPWPTVLMIPPAKFDSADDTGVPSERQATATLQAAGFLVFQIESRLSNPRHVTGQPAHQQPDDTSGTPAQQQGDIQRQVLAALADTAHCDGRIYLVGGSSGGCHALWVALTSTASDGSGWNAAARGHIKAVVSLSGPTDLGNWTDYDKDANGDPLIDIAQFIADGENYTSRTQNPPDDPDKQVILTANSPISLMPHATAVPPILMFATELDPVPWQQGSNMFNALFHPRRANCRLS